MNNLHNTQMRVVKKWLIKFKSLKISYLLNKKKSINKKNTHYGVYEF